MIRHLTLCADDYAQSPGISQGILQLIEAKRLTATSVFSLSAHWPDAARDLSGLDADIGLHLDLTEPFATDSHPLSWWLIRSQLRLLSRAQLRGRILAQIDAFADALGRLPDYIDGHQHVHALPVIRQALTDAIAERWENQPLPYVRLPDLLADAGDSGVKGWILKTCCAGFAQHIARSGLTAPAWFAGMYSFDPRTDYAALMERWLASCPDGGLIMCHPGLADTAADPIAATRPLEYRYLASAAFADACREQNIELSRFQV
jgi:predicted glycoside hydrolase/deacetylase ChbG (UPF0249 family)